MQQGGIYSEIICVTIDSSANIYCELTNLIKEPWQIIR